MKRHIHTSEKKHFITTTSVFMSAWLVMMSCSHRLLVEPIAGDSQQDSSQQVVAYCEAETTSTLMDKIKFIKDSSDTFANMGKKAGTTSDLITNSDDDTGANTGESVGTILGLGLGIKAIYDENSREEHQMKQCLHERGYQVKRVG